MLAVSNWGGGKWVRLLVVASKRPIGGSDEWEEGRKKKKSSWFCTTRLKKKRRQPLKGPFRCRIHSTVPLPDNFSTSKIPSFHSCVLQSVLKWDMLETTINTTTSTIRGSEDQNPFMMSQCYQCFLTTICIPGPVSQA